MAAFLKIELLHSAIGRDQTQKDTLRGLGLRRPHQQRILKDTPAIRGMLNKIRDLVRFETTKESQLAPKVPVVTYVLGPVPAARPPKEKKAAKPVAVEGSAGETKVKPQKKDSHHEAHHASAKKTVKPSAKKKA